MPNTQHEFRAKKTPYAEPLKAILSLSATLVTLVTAFLFLIGWIYLSEYYLYFGVDVAALDLPVYALLVNALMTVLQIAITFVPWLLKFIIILGLVFLFRRLQRSIRFSSWLKELSWLKNFLGLRVGSETARLAYRALRENQSIRHGTGFYAGAVLLQRVFF